MTYGKRLLLLGVPCTYCAPPHTQHQLTSIEFCQLFRICIHLLKISSPSPAPMAIHVLANYVVPIVGMIIAWGLGVSPLTRVNQAQTDGRLGDYNPLPSTVFLMNSIAWLFYGGLIKNIFIIILKLVLIIINLQLTLVSYTLASDAMKKQMEAVIHGFLAILLLFYLLFFLDVSPKYLQESFGYFCMVLNLLIFAAPFSTIRQVVLAQNSSGINLPFALWGFMGTFFWLIYGLVIAEIPLIVPNGVGVVLNLLQLALCFMLKRDNIHKSNELSNHGDMILVGAKSCEQDNDSGDSSNA